MKHLLYAVTLACLSITTAASAEHFSGSMTGVAPPSTLDYNNDGINGRDFVLPTLLDWHWRSIEGSVDTGLIALPRVLDPASGNTCPLDTDFELSAFGDVGFLSKWTKATVILEVDQSVHLCFTPGNEEVVELFVTKATNDDGVEIWASGTAQIRLTDVVMRTNPVTGFPEIVMTIADYDLNVFYEDDDLTIVPD